MTRSHVLESNFSTISYPSHIITIKMIKNIVFDFGGVLVQHDFIAYFADFFIARRRLVSFLPKRCRIVLATR